MLFSDLGEKMKLNKVQISAYELIQSDARFLYTLIDIQRNAKRISSNYVMMCQPYIGIFTDGAEQWCRKVGLNAPCFNEKEREYYNALRQGHKLLEKTYAEYTSLLMAKLEESDRYFYSKRSLYEKIHGYFNVGTDLCNGKYCGNTILGAAHTPFQLFGREEAGSALKELSVVAGKLAAFFDCKSFPPYLYDDEKNIVEFKDYHFFNKCPLNEKTDLGVVLFSILCNINYVTVFINDYFVEEIPQKFKYAYLQYYYLCDFIKEINKNKGLKLNIDISLQNREFRNCLAHYGLGQYLGESDIISSDVLKGLTKKAFSLEYDEAKCQLYKQLNNLSHQIQNTIF